MLWTASDGAAGDGFGSSVALAQGLAAVGASGTAVGANQNAGAVYVFEEPVGGWVAGSETARLVTSDGERLGYAVGAFGDTVVAGSQNADVGGNQDQGAAYVFARPSSGWVDATETQVIAAADGAAQDGFGEAVALDGATVVIGSRYADTAGQFNRGRAYVFVDPATPGATGPASSA